MRFGPTSVRLTTVLAKSLRRPKLRTDLKISEQLVAGEKSFVIKIPETEAYNRFGPFEFGVLSLFDGSRTMADVAEEMNRRDPEAGLDEEQVADFFDSMDSNLWERSVGEKNLAILEKIREERNERVSSSSVLYMYFSAWDPDKVLARMHPYLKWFFTPGFVIFSVLLFLSTVIIVAADWGRIRQDTIEFYSFTHKTGYDLWIFWILLFFISGVHEFGHGLSCKHFGGEVHQMGLMLVFFTPAFYTDCTDMHMFDRTSKRLWTIFNGIWVEMVVCGISTLIWYFSPPGSFIGDLSYKMLLLTGVSGVFFNLNPLMKFDGYYALAQYLAIDNMREDAFDYLKQWVSKVIFRKDIDLPHVGKRKRRIFLIFGICAFLYSTFILVIFSLFIKNVFTSKFGDWGYPLTALAVFLLLRKRLRKSWPAIKNSLRENGEKLMAWKFTRFQQIAILGAVILVTVPPTTTQVATDFTLEPGARAEVRAPVAGLISEVRIHEGDTVTAGSVLGVLSNPEIDAKASLAEKQVALSERELEAARSRGDLGAAEQHLDQLARARTELAEARKKLEALTLHAPMDGVVTTPQVEARVGAFLKEGDDLALIVDRKTVRARILVRDWELEDVFEGAQAKLKVRAFPFKTFVGKVEQIMPAAAMDRPVTDPKKLERYGQETTNYFAVVLSFSNEDGALQEGMTGTAKIYGKRYPIAVRAGRSFWRWLRSQVW